MKLLKELADQTAIPELAFNTIKSNIRKGAADLEQKWPNALYLVNKAYNVANVELPTPADIGGYKQFEELLRFAVGELAKSRGINGDWRMSIQLPDKINEQTLKPRLFTVLVKYTTTTNGNETENSLTVKATNIQSIVSTLKRNYKSLNFNVSDWTEEEHSQKEPLKGKILEITDEQNRPIGVTIKILPIHDLIDR